MLQGYVGKFLDVTNFPFFLDMSYFVCFFNHDDSSLLCCWEESPYKVVLPTASSELVLVFFDVLVSCCFVVLRWVPC